MVPSMSTLIGFASVFCLLLLLFTGAGIESIEDRHTTQVYRRMTAFIDDSKDKNEK